MTFLAVLAALTAWALLSFLIGCLVGRVLRFLDAPGEPSRAEPGDPRSLGSAFDAVQFAWPPSVPYPRPSDWSPLLTLIDRERDA